jgi:DNA-binding response OmpR family regulator
LQQCFRRVKSNFQIADLGNGQWVFRRLLDERGTPGLEIVDDWDSFGQRTTGSGTVILENVRAVVVIDKALPDLSGLDLCRIIKSESRTLSIFVLLLLDDANDQLNAFELGAADCVMKPFNIRRLVLQIRNLLRSMGDSVATEVLKVGDLILDRARHEVRAASSVVQCTPKEFVILDVLMERSGWGGAGASPRCWLVK